MGAGQGCDSRGNALADDDRKSRVVTLASLDEVLTSLSCIFIVFGLIILIFPLAKVSEQYNVLVCAGSLIAGLTLFWSACAVAGQGGSKVLGEYRVKEVLPEFSPFDGLLAEARLIEAAVAHKVWEAQHRARYRDLP